MPLRFVIGRSGSGKTTWCLNDIRNRLHDQPDGAPLVMLVPEQATFQTEYELLRGSNPAGVQLQGTLRAQALSFRRLAFRVMQEVGGIALTPISDTGKHMLLYKIVNRYASQLQLFQGGAKQAGFIERLSELLTEWKRYGLDSDRLEQFMGEEKLNSGLLHSKLHDLNLVYNQLEAELAGHYIDAEDYLIHLKHGFEQASSMKEACFWIDGFFGFTPTEYEALGVLMASSADVIIALTVDRAYKLTETPHELDLFYPVADTYGKLLSLADQHNVDVLPTIDLNRIEQDGKCLPRFQQNAMLAHLEQHFGKRIPYFLSTDKLDQHSRKLQGVSLHAASSRRAEVEAVAREIRRRVQEDDIRWRDIAIFVRNGQDYTDYLSIVFDDYDIPYFVDQKEKALHHPLIEFIRSALEVVLVGWRYDAIFRCIKTEMLVPMDASIPREWFDELENHVLATGIDGWKWLDRRSWRPQGSASLDHTSGDEPIISERNQLEYERVMTARDAVVPLLQQFGEALKKSANVQEMCEALYHLLNHADVADRLELWSQQDLELKNTRRARSHRQLWNSVMAMHEQLVDLAGHECLTTDLFAGMIEAGLDSMKLASVPPALDQVLVGSMDRTRSGQIAVCFVLGANDGIMPMRVQEDGLLTESERDQLVDSGIPLAPSVKRRLLDERFMIYNAFTVPSDHLWISWAQADEEGKSLLPSEVIRQMRGMFPGVALQETAIEPTPSMDVIDQKPFLMHPERAMSYLITMLRSWQQGSEIDQIWWDLYNWYAVRPEWQARLSLFLSALSYHNHANPLSELIARELYGTTMQVSVSRMERFVSCPFQHFAIHGLKLRERKLYRLQAPDVGQLYHAALSQLADELGRDWGRRSSSEIRLAVDNKVDEIMPKLQSQILLSSSRMRFIAKKLKEIVAQTTLILGEQARRADFHPVGTEVGFGPAGQMPALVLPLNNGGFVEVIGRIDRVDAAQTEQGQLLRIIDYKSSATTLKLEEIIHGLSLQMLTYLDVIISYSEQWLGRPSSPAGVLYFHVHNPILSMTNKLSSSEIEQQRFKRYKLKGLLTADADVVRLMDNELDSGYSEVLPVALKKDGSFYRSSSVVTNEQWTLLRGAVRSRITQMGTSIQSGVVTIEPYRLGNKTPCQYCKYKPVCQFDPLLEGNDYRKLSKPQKDEVWQQLEEE